MIVEPIPKSEVMAWLLKRHYAKRVPCIQYSFGLFDKGICLGVVTFGPTPTPAVQEHICGGEFKEKVVELNRLCIEGNNHNFASFLVMGAIRLLPKPLIIVSYADTAMNHIGYIYQATNFLYTGAVTAHDAEYILDGKKTHARSITASGISNPKAWARENKIERIEPKPKHRYIMFIGSHKQKKKMLSKLTYPIISQYPKGQTSRYEANNTIDKQINFGFSGFAV